MAPPAVRDVTGLLVAWKNGDRVALDQLVPLVYAELHRLAHAHMRGERPDHLLQTTALVNEAYLRLTDVTRVQWHDRTHFFAVAAQMMRRVLVDAARERGAHKRGGGINLVPLDEAHAITGEPSIDLVALDEALDELSKFDPRKVQVIELRYFAGLTVEETAGVVGVSPDTVMRDWKIARLWLLRELCRTEPESPRPPS